jgi:hypothetical protein
MEIEKDLGANYFHKMRILRNGNRMRLGANYFQNLKI